MNSNEERAKIYVNKADFSFDSIRIKISGKQVNVAKAAEDSIGRGNTVEDGEHFAEFMSVYSITNAYHIACDENKRVHPPPPFPP